MKSNKKSLKVYQKEVRKVMKERGINYAQSVQIVKTYWKDRDKKKTDSVDTAVKAADFVKDVVNFKIGDMKSKSSNTESKDRVPVEHQKPNHVKVWGDNKEKADKAFEGMDYTLEVEESPNTDDLIYYYVFNSREARQEAFRALHYGTEENENMNEEFRKGGRITKEFATEIALSEGINLRSDFHRLDSMQVARLIELAKQQGYQKPKNASGSRGRYFFYYLQKGLGEYAKGGSTYAEGGKTHTMPDGSTMLNSEHYAKGGEVNFHDTKLSKLQSWENRKSKGGKKSFGAFAHKLNNKYLGDYYLYELDDFDKKMYSHIKLKDGEVLARTETDNMVGGESPLIKINIKNGRVYFMSDSSDEKNPKFDTSSVNVMFISLDKKMDKYAKGGTIELKKGTKLKFTESGNIIFIIESKGDGYDFKSAAAPREIDHAPKGWFDMMIKRGKLVRFDGSSYAKGGKTMSQQLIDLNQEGKKKEARIMADDFLNDYSCDNESCRKNYGGDYNGGYCSDECKSSYAKGGGVSDLTDKEKLEFLNWHDRMIWWHGRDLANGYKPNKSGYKELKKDLGKKEEQYGNKLSNFTSIDPSKWSGATIDSYWNNLMEEYQESSTYAKGGELNIGEAELIDTDGVEYEIWQDNKTDKMFNVPIERLEDSSYGEPQITRHLKEAVEVKGYAKGGTLWARQDDVTGKGMNEGFIVNDGDKYYANEKDLIKHLRSVDIWDEDVNSMSDDDLLELSYDEEYHLYTEWYDEDDMEFEEVDGELISRFAKGGLVKKKIGLPLQRRINEINDMISIAVKEDLIVLCDFQSTWEHMIEIKPIVVKNQFVTLEYKELGWGSKGVNKDRYNINDEWSLDELKWNLSQFRKSLKKAIIENGSDEYAEGGQVQLINNALGVQSRKYNRTRKFTR